MNSNADTAIVGEGPAGKPEAPLLLARPDKVSLIRALENGDTARGSGDYRLALFDPSADRVQKAIKIIKRGRSWRNRQDIWFSHEMLIRDGKIALLYPGLDGLTGGEISSVARYFDLPMAGGSGDLRTTAQGGIDEKGRIDGQKGAAGEVTEKGGVGTAGGAARQGVLESAIRLAERTQVLDAALKRCGVRADLVAGHSVGEWLAGFAAGWTGGEDAAAMLRRQDAAIFEGTDTPFLVIGCSSSELRSFVSESEEIHIANDNCPQQVIVCGREEAIESLQIRLREKQVFHQLLAFRSGFHTIYLEPRVSALLQGFESIRFRRPEIPLWSATTLQPYPDTHEGIRDLTREHLLRTVRFRELTEKLYSEGVQVFIQVGSGGLPGFIEDTLKGKAYSVVAASSPARSGLAQLQRVIAALFAEGDERAGIPVVTVGAGTGMRVGMGQKTDAIEMQVAPAMARNTHERGLPVGIEQKTGMEVPVNLAAVAQHSPLMKALLENQREMDKVQSELLALFCQRYENRSAMVPFQRQLDISLSDHPYLADHALMRQRPGWPYAADTDPVIPMTMLLELLAETAEAVLPGRVVRGIAGIRVWQWMSVAEPFRETIRGEWMADGKLELTVEKYARAEMLFIGPEDMPGAGDMDIGAALSIRIMPQQIYEQHMFHGYGYQGIVEVIRVAADGIAGMIRAGTGMGSLLDNAGQLFGLWLQLTLPQEKIAFPVSIKEVSFYGDRRAQDGLFECVCRLRSLTDEYATADFMIKKDGKIWAVIRGWQNRRLELDDRFWKVAVAPLGNFLSKELRPGIFFFDNAYTRALTWDFVGKRYFSQPERQQLADLSPKRKKEWTISRVAAKDALRAWLLRHRGESYYPAELLIRSDGKGRPWPDGPMAAGVHVSLAHKDLLSVAIAADRPVGIDIEAISSRSDEFARIAFHPEELTLIGERDPAEWMTRCWVAKEAYGKSLGMGLQGDPLRYRIHQITGNEIRIGDIVIETFNHKNHIIGWTR